MCNPPKIPSMNDISDQLARVNQQARQIIANPLAALSVLVLGPALGLIGGALVDDKMRNDAADAYAADNQAQIDAMNQQQAEADKALADAQAASDAATAAANQAAIDATNAQAEAQVPASGEVPWTSAAQQEAAQQAAALAPSGGSLFPSGGSLFPSGGGGGGGGFGPVPDVSAVEAAQPPPFEMGPTPAFDLRTQYMQSQALDQEFIEQSQPVEAPQEFFPEDETAQLTISDQQSSESFEGFGRVINYPEAEDIGFSKIPSAMYTPLIEYDESHAPVYKESGPLLPIHNRMKADLERPDSGSMTPSGGLIPSYNNPMYAIQDIPEELPNRLIDYSSRGHQTSMPIRRSELPLSMPIRTNFGNPNAPSPFTPMIQDLRSLQDHLTQLIKNAESYTTYNRRFSGMVDIRSVMAPIRRNLDELESATKYIKRSRKSNRPASAEEHEQSRYVKKLVDDLTDDVRTLNQTISQAGG